LIVEFASTEYDRGTDLVEAALAGARLRLRPIIMTSFAFIAGCVPLALASGSGAVARRVLGTGVIGGMLAASLVAIFLIPAGFCLVERVAAFTRGSAPPAGVPGASAQPGGPDR
jgi:hydrophobic/amphiphilic exporter-1 (mainly G- bacteria), HAE1 family